MVAFHLALWTKVKNGVASSGTGKYDRPMYRVLFVCDKARMRSPTAADTVAAWSGFETDFGRLGKDADEQLSTQQLEWADTVAVMEARQRRC